MSLATTYDPAGEHQHDPYQIFGRLRDEEPVSYDAKTGLHLVTRYDTVKYVAAHPELFSSAGANPMHPENQPEPLNTILSDIDPMGKSVLEVDGEEHRVNRAVWNSYFHGKVMNALRDGIRRQARAHVAALSGQRVSDLRTDLIEPYVSACVGQELMGLPDGDYQASQQHAADIITWSTPWLPMEERVAAAQRTASVMGGPTEKNWYRAWYQHLRERPITPTLLSMAAHMSSYDQFLVFTISWIPAVRTTVGGLLHAIYHVLRQGVWPSMKDAEGATAAWDESLRLDSPHRGIARTVTQNTSLDGTRLHAEDRLLLLFGAANRDERHFEKPAVFDLCRSNVRDHLAFGFGTHICVGKHLASLEATTLLTELAAAFPGMALCTPGSLSYEADLFFRMPRTLQVAL